MDKTIKTSRLVLFLMAVMALAAVLFVSMYRLQIVEGEKEYAASKNSIVTESTAVAARGPILDRYGRVMVSNRTCNNLIINSGELFEQEDPNAVILQLAREVVDSGNKYTDTLPITKEAPFEYVKKMSDLQKTILEGYLKENDLALTTTAVELMAFFRAEAFEIDANYTSEETRIIAGIRYEIKVRYINAIHTNAYIFAQDVGVDLPIKLMENNIPGFEVRTSFIREVNTKFAPHTLGYIGMIGENEQEKYKKLNYPGDAMVGQAGIEKAFESILHGTDGKKMVATTKAGTILQETYTVDPVPGNNLYVTLDEGMQEAASLALSSNITEANAKRTIDNETLRAQGNTKDIKNMITGGAIAAVQVKTGEPICLVSYPDFDLSTLLENYNEILNQENAPLLNRALMGLYAPGSTFKPCVALAALDSGTVTPQFSIYDKGKYETVDPNYSPVCWIYGKGSHGDVNATRAVAVSCNYYFYWVGERLGIKVMSDYANRFGLGLATGIELPEELGVMSTPEYKEDNFNESWYPGDTIQSAIGQSYTMFTPLQMANYCAAIANNGTRYEASILKAVRSYDYSQSLYERTPKVAGEVEMNQEYYDAVKLGMYKAVNEEGGIVGAALGNFMVPVAAKTGTAQLGDGITNNGMLICFAPYDDPEIAVAIAIQHGNSGAEAASIARDVLSYYFNFKNATVSLETENALLK